MQHFNIERKIIIPEKVEIAIEPLRNGKKVIVKGPKGVIEKSFDRLIVNVEKENDTVTIFSYFGKKKQASMVGTINGHLNNMIKGVQEGYKYTVRIISSHFPATAEIKKDAVLIKNLYGRKDPINVPISFPKDVNIRIREEEFIDITGIDKEKVSQMAGLLAEKSRLRGKKAKDPTRFQDGLYVVES